MNDEDVRRLGEKLFAEVEAEGLSSVLTSLRGIHLARCENTDSDQGAWNDGFGIAKLDDLVTGPSPSIVEMVSPPAAHHPSGTGKTTLLYLIIAQAILPSFFSSSIRLGGQNSAVIMLEPLNHFSVSHLASVTLSLLKFRLSAAGVMIDERIKFELKQTLERSLLHVHIFWPQSWPSLLLTLRSLPAYLLDHSRQGSMQRRIHSIILEDVDSYVWSIRNSASDTSMASNPNPLSAASNHLTAQLEKLATTFSCHTILTSHSALPSAFRPALPTSWPHRSSLTRLALRRLEVIKFTPAISVDDAEAERQQRWDVVSKRCFECWRVGTELKGAEGFVFTVGVGGGVEV
ncbi:hypothetical protein T440DRAFT_472375 [Plenodomus tracheiphilus IPT5]|uniref:DNA recombination and repair protein Rad51-like C-terminal domain-containing protein n=1 Tax=Plenodomus tracheiphilus IPT5 TaxID=1408161 RepID=A0A6A7ARG8_9PLEO|nr:hypothetical protein T440DRAFT_472375 [Plenodomus tracheiphilus IPT5]